MENNELFLEIVEAKLQNITTSISRVNWLIAYTIAAICSIIISLLYVELIPYALTILCGILVILIGFVIKLNLEIEDYINFVSVIPPGEKNDTIFKKRVRREMG